MNALTEKKIRIGDVLAALGMKRTTLRNWFDRNEVVLMSPPPESGWAEFTLGDVSVLAVMHRLVRWGLDVQLANQIAKGVIKAAAGPMLSYRSTPAEAFIALMSGKTLMLSLPEGSGDPVASLLTTRAELLHSEIWADGDKLQADVPYHLQDVLMIDLRSVLLAVFRELDVIDPAWPG